MQKQAQKTDNIVKQQEKESKHPIGEDKAYVRVNEALKVVIPNN